MGICETSFGTTTNFTLKQLYGQSYIWFYRKGFSFLKDNNAKYECSTIDTSKNMNLVKNIVAAFRGMHVWPAKHSYT